VLLKRNGFQVLRGDERREQPGHLFEACVSILKRGFMHARGSLVASLDFLSLLVVCYPCCRSRMRDFTILILARSQSSVFKDSANTTALCIGIFQRSRLINRLLLTNCLFVE
jgi:hypothetical protein